MKRLRTIAVLFAALLAAAGPTFAQSLKEARSREAASRALERELAYTRSVCGNGLQGSIEWRSTAHWPASANLVRSCDGALGAVEAICRTPGGKAKARNITLFVCAGDGAGASLSGGALRYGASPGVSGYSDTKALLDSKF